MREFMLERYVHLNLNSFVKLQLQTDEKVCLFSLWKKEISRIIFFYLFLSSVSAANLIN